MGCLDWKLLPGSPTLRNWRPGDRYQPIGTPGEKKLKFTGVEGFLPPVAVELAATGAPEVPEPTLPTE